MGRHAKYFTVEEKRAARAQRARNSASKREYDRGRQRKKRGQQKSQQSSNDETQESVSAELNGQVPQLNRDIPMSNDEPPVVETYQYHNSEAWGGMSLILRGF